MYIGWLEATVLSIYLRKIGHLYAHSTYFCRLRPPCHLDPAQLNLYEPTSSIRNAAYSQQSRPLRYLEKEETGTDIEEKLRHSESTRSVIQERRHSSTWQAERRFTTGALFIQSRLLDSLTTSLLNPLEFAKQVVDAIKLIQTSQSTSDFNETSSSSEPQTEGNTEPVEARA